MSTSLKSFKLLLWTIVKIRELVKFSSLQRAPRMLS